MNINLCKCVSSINTAHIYSSSMTNDFLSHSVCHFSCLILFHYTYILPYTILYLHTFPYVLPLHSSHTTYSFSLTWYIHPCLYNSANSVPSAENAIPQIVKTPPWYFTAQLKCWQLNICHLINVHSILSVLL